METVKQILGLVKAKTSFPWERFLTLKCLVLCWQLTKLLNCSKPACLLVLERGVQLYSVGRLLQIHIILLVNFFLRIRTAVGLLLLCNKLE